MKDEQGCNCFINRLIDLSRLSLRATAGCFYCDIRDTKCGGIKSRCYRGFFFTEEMNEEVKPDNRESSELGISLVEQLENGKNKHLIKCKFCPSKILNPNMGIYLENKFDLPMMTRKRKSDEVEEIQYETVTHFWQINDMYTFENISFSNTVGNTKYLACADCEVGPVGYFNMDTKISYIALGRVHHVK